MTFLITSLMGTSPIRIIWWGYILDYKIAGIGGFLKKFLIFLKFFFIFLKIFLNFSEGYTEGVNRLLIWQKPFVFSKSIFLCNRKTFNSIRKNTKNKAFWGQKFTVWVTFWKSGVDKFQYVTYTVTTNKEHSWLYI